jgi:hypothetical protein
VKDLRLPIILTCLIVLPLVCYAGLHALETILTPNPDDKVAYDPAPQPQRLSTGLPEIDLVPQIGHQQYFFGRLYHLTFSPDGRTLAVNDAGYRLCIFDLEKGEQPSPGHSTMPLK